MEVTSAIQDEVEYTVPLWIIIVSALAGVLLLALIIALLWKVCALIRKIFLILTLDYWLLFTEEM